MLNRLIPQNSRLRQQLICASRWADFAVTSKLKRRFTQPTPEKLVELRRLLETTYLPGWYPGIDMRTIIPSAEGQETLRNHLFVRLEMDRYEIVPWLNLVLPLEGHASWKSDVVLDQQRLPSRSKVRMSRRWI